jgi:long-chain fatty acid transport protein
MKTLSTYSTKILGGLLLSPLLLGSHGSLAGGFQLSDHSISGLGRSQAGYGLVADDASAAFFNPAAMSLLSKKQFQIGAAFVKAEGKFTNTGSTNLISGDDEDGAQSSITPNIYWVLPIGERGRFGLAINSPFGTSTDYPSNFIGATDGLITNIETLNINPSFSYKVTNTTSVGFGINYQEFTPILSGKANPNLANSELRIEGDSKKFGYNFGIMFNFADDSRLGLSYRSKIDHEIEGSATFSGLPAGFNGSFAATADFTAPETIYAAYTKPINEKWQLSLGYRWTRWSRFQELDILYPTAPVALGQNNLITTQWNDSETISIGTDYKYNSKWTFRTGFALDQTPVPDATRSVRTVDSDRTWYSIGASYNSNENLQFDVAYRYISFENAPVNRNVRGLGRLVGEYNDINIHTLALQMNYKY